jgi:hypothetical protein
MDRRCLAALPLVLAACTAPAQLGAYRYDPETRAYHLTVQVRLHTKPDYTVALVDGVEEVGANSTLRLRADQPHRVELRKAGYFGQVLHYTPNPDAAPPVAEGPAVGPADAEAPASPRPPVFLVEVENLATGERQPIDGLDPRIALEPIPKLAAPEGAPQVVAVMPTVAQTDLPPEVLDLVTDHLRVGLAARRVAVIDRGRLAAALAQQVRDEKAASYRPCVDEACQVPLGRALAATHILRSSITRLGDSCTLAAELVELRSEVTVAARYLDTACRGEALGHGADGLAQGLLQSER